MQVSKNEIIALKEVAQGEETGVVGCNPMALDKLIEARLCEWRFFRGMAYPSVTDNGRLFLSDLAELEAMEASGK